MASPKASPARFQLPLRYPVTGILVAALLCVAIVTGSAWHTVPHAVVRAAGFRPTDGLHLDLVRLFGAALFTDDPWGLAQALVLTGVGVALLERRAGSGWALAAFAGLHALAFATVTLLYAVPATAGLVRDTRDIGASAGYFGVLAVIAAGSPRWRWGLVAFTAVTASVWLVSASAPHALGRSVNAGAEHVATLVYGGVAGLLAQRRLRARRRLGHRAPS